MRAAGLALTALGVLLVAAALVLFAGAIWTVGPDSARLFGTGVLALIVGAVLGCLGLDLGD